LRMRGGSDPLVDHPFRVWRDGVACLRQAYSGHALFFGPAESAHAAEAARRVRALEVPPQRPAVAGGGDIRGTVSKAAPKARGRTKPRGR